jgi:hypothetical protein
LTALRREVKRLKGLAVSQKSQIGTTRHRSGDHWCNKPAFKAEYGLSITTFATAHKKLLFPHERREGKGKKGNGMAHPFRG